MAPRAYWKGYLKLSLVSCPIALYPASSGSERVSFNRINAKTGNQDDLSTDTRIAVTVNVRPDFVVRFGAAFGATEPARPSASAPRGKSPTRLPLRRPPGRRLRRRSSRPSRKPRRP